MHKYIVCIGSNYNRKENLTFARQKLTESFSSICFAPELETKPLFFKESGSVFQPSGSVLFR
mgnify:CR=1 FL=1